MEDGINNKICLWKDVMVTLLTGSYYIQDIEQLYQITGSKGYSIFCEVKQ